LTPVYVLFIKVDTSLCVIYNGWHQSMCYLQWLTLVFMIFIKVDTSLCVIYKGWHQSIWLSSPCLRPCSSTPAVVHSGRHQKSLPGAVKRTGGQISCTSITLLKGTIRHVCDLFFHPRLIIVLLQVLFCCISHLRISVPFEL